MLSIEFEKTLTNWIAIGSAFVTLVILAGPVSDPVNVTKLLSAGAVSFGVLFLILTKTARRIIIDAKIALITLFLFNLFAIIATLKSKAPLLQNIYGDSGRNTGFLAYFILSIMLLASTLFSQTTSFGVIVKYFVVAGSLNVAYGYWSWLVGDFIPWNNIYGNLLGTFGNPNFMGAFLGMFSSVLAVFTLNPNASKRLRSMSAIAWLLTFPAMLQTSAVQGLLLTLGGAGLAFLAYLYLHIKKRILLSITSIIFVGTALLAVLGSLQIGPLSQFIYKRSVSLRGSYWNAAIEMGKANPFNGIGMDSYGTFYRQYRSLKAATSMPGAEVQSNAAHSVPLDLLAYGGFPLFFSYVILIIVGLICLIKVIRRQKGFDPIFLSIAIIWVTYQIQSLISINQIGLAIWGWISTGSLIAYERLSRESKSENKVAIELKNRRASQSDFVSTGLIASMGAVVGILLAIPPFTADAAITSAIRSQNLEKLESAMAPGYFHPTNSRALGNTVQILEASKLYDLALKYAHKGIEFSPYSFDAWKALYYTTNVTLQEKARAKAKMIQLDPHNKSLLELP